MQGKVQNSSPILRWNILAKERCKIHHQCQRLARKGAKFIANFCATKVTSLPSLSLSLSLSLSPSAPHAQYRKRFRTSYNTLPVHVHTLVCGSACPCRGNSKWSTVLAVISKCAPVSVLFILISAFAICTGPGTCCHPHSLLLSQFRSRIR